MEIKSIQEGLWWIDRRTYMVDLDQLTPGRSDNDGKKEMLFFCPACEYEGEPNSRNTMYFNTIKLEGWCHRCKSKFILYSDKPMEQILLELEIRKISHKHNSGEQEVRLKSIPAFPYEAMFSPPSDFCKKYLASRNPLLTGLEDALMIREMPGVGVSVPIWFDDRIISYNLRYYQPMGKMKYFIPEGSKYVYSPNRALSRGADFSEITLCEGYFDAIAATLDGYPNPLAVQGLHLTEVQARIIGKFFPDKCRVYLDKLKLSWDLLRSARGKLKTVSQFEVVPTYGDDPEEIMMSNIVRKGADYVEFLVENRDHLIKSLTRS